MEKIRWAKLYKKAGDSYHKIRKLAQQKVFEDDGDYVCQLEGGHRLVRLNQQGEAEFSVPLSEEPDQLVLDRDNDRFVTLTDNRVATYELETGNLVKMRFLNGHHRRSLAVDRDGEIHIEEGRRVFSYGSRLEEKGDFGVDFAPCEVLHHSGSQTWLFEEYKPRSILITDEQGEPRYRSDGKLELFDTSLDSFLMLESAPEGDLRVVRQEGEALQAHPVPKDVSLAYPAGKGTLLIGSDEDSTKIRLLNSDGEMLETGQVPGGAYDFFATADAFYVLTGLPSEEGPIIHRLSRISRESGQVEELHQLSVDASGPIHAAENQQGNLVIQAPGGVLELDPQGKVLSEHANPAEMSCRELKSWPVFEGGRLTEKPRAGWQAFCEKGLKFNYPTVFGQNELPFLTSDGMINFSESLSATEKEREFAQLGLDENPKIVSGDQTYILAPDPKERPGEPDHYAADAGANIYLYNGEREPKLARYARKGDRLSTFLPLKHDYTRYLAVGLESGVVEYGSEYFRSRYQVDSPVESFRVYSGHLVSQAEDGSELVLETRSEMMVPDSLESEEVELFGQITGELGGRRGLVHYQISSQIFELTKSLAPEQRPALGKGLAQAINRIPVREVRQFVEAIRPEQALTDLRSLEQWLELGSKPEEYEWADQFGLYRNAKPQTQKLMEHVLNEELSLRSFSSILSKLNANGGADHLANFKLLNENWSDYDLALDRPSELSLDDSVSTVHKLRELHNRAPDSKWSLPKAFRSIVDRGWGPEAVDTYADTIVVGGAQALDVVLLNELPESDIDLEFDENALTIGGQVLSRNH